MGSILIQLLPGCAYFREELSADVRGYLSSESKRHEGPIEMFQHLPLLHQLHRDGSRAITLRNPPPQSHVILTMLVLLPRCLSGPE